MRATVIVYGLVCLLAACMPLLGIYPVFGMKLLCFAMFACAFNLLLGFGGRNGVASLGIPIIGSDTVDPNPAWGRRRLLIGVLRCSPVCLALR